MVKNLRVLRIAKGYSQQQLANELGLSQQSINKYENHNVEPDITTLIAIANLFDTTVDHLVGNTSDTNSEFTLRNSEIDIIKGYRKLNLSEKNCIRILIETYNSMK